ncbi:hypothetical protein BGZ83_006997 [Gryganskiella cystojenkinii]|nr:hypothetical protein BGZ83_006997 [Gryganskiella cystojenkinii]
MSHDDLLIRNAIRARGINASVEWTRQCLESVKASNPSSSTWNDQQLVNHVYEMYLLADLRSLDPKPLLPSANSTPHKQQFFPRLGTTLSSTSSSATKSTMGEGDGAILQILDIKDIGTSSLKTLETCEAIEAAAAAAADPTEGPAAEKTLPKSFLSLDVTDGVRKAQAMVRIAVPGLFVDMKLGAKIRVLDAEIRHGVLQLTPKNTILLGGEVASLNKEPRVPVIMRKLQERLGLLPNVAPAPRVPGMNAPHQQAATPLATIHQPQPLRPVIAHNHNIWMNPKSAVTAADAIPATHSTSAIGSNSAGAQALPSPPLARIIRNDMPNPWRPNQPPVRPQPQPLVKERPNDQDDYYMQSLRDQEPQWENFGEMDIEDDIRLPEEEEDTNLIDVGWTGRDSSSRINSNQSYRAPQIAPVARAPQAIIESTPPRVRERRMESPPLIATTSPAKKRAAVLSLRAPRTFHRAAQAQQDRVPGEWEVGNSQPLNQNTKRPRSDSGDDEEDQAVAAAAMVMDDDHDDDNNPFQDLTRLPSLSPVLDADDDWILQDQMDDYALPPQIDYEQMLENLDDYKDESEDWFFRRHTSPLMDMDFMDDEDDRQLPLIYSQGQDQLPSDDDEVDAFNFSAVSQKRGVSPELEEDKDTKDSIRNGYTNRRRSQSFSLLPRKTEGNEDKKEEEDEIEKIRIKLERGVPGPESMEQDEPEATIKLSQSRERSEERVLVSVSIAAAPSPGPESNAVKDEMALDLIRIKAEKMEVVEHEQSGQIEIMPIEESLVEAADEIQSAGINEIESTEASGAEPENVSNIVNTEITDPPAQVQNQEYDANVEPMRSRPLSLSPPSISPPPAQPQPESLAATTMERQMSSGSDSNAEKRRAGGTSMLEAIDLSSDDDDDEDTHATFVSRPETDVPALDIHTVVIKTEPGLEPSTATGGKHNTMPSLSRSSSLVMIKPEETLLEFDMDDMDDFGGLKEVAIPEVELDQVLGLVREDKEVKTKARIHKLGKFCLTNLAVAIPIFLMPVTPSSPIATGIQDAAREESVSGSGGISSSSEHGDSSSTLTATEILEGVLDQEVIERFFDLSIAEFRKLIALKKGQEAKEAVARMRSRFMEVKTVECRIRGIRQGVPVIRELHIISRRE